MKVMIAGASGAIGRRLVPQLLAAGHEVVGTTRSPSRFGALSRAGARPLQMDGLDPDSVRRAVLDTAPEVIIHEMTSLARMGNPKHFDREFALTNRLRTEGLNHLLAAALDAGVRRIVAQSYTGWPNERAGSPVKDETDPLDPHPTHTSRETLEAIRYLEETVTGEVGIEGLALRYGSFYGPGTSLAPGASMLEMVRRGRFPIIGGGGGIFSFVHIDDAAAATVSALERGRSDRYNIVDDDPAPASEWLPYLAEIAGARPPMSMPAWLARLLVGEQVVSMMTVARGSSNAKAKRELGWTPRYASWRDGFRAVLAGA